MYVCTCEFCNAFTYLHTVNAKLLMLKTLNTTVSLLHESISLVLNQETLYPSAYQNVQTFQNCSPFTFDTDFQHDLETGREIE